MPYKEIASRLNVTVDQVKYLFRGEKRTKKKKTEAIENCLNCNRPIEQNETGRKRKYCSDKCRDSYKYKHRAMPYVYYCTECGERYMSSTRYRGFCSKSFSAKHNHEIRRYNAFRQGQR